MGSQSLTRLSDFHYVCTEPPVLHELRHVVSVAILWGRFHYLKHFFGGGGGGGRGGEGPILLGMQDLSSSTRELWSLNHWTTKKFFS